MVLNGRQWIFGFSHRHAGQGRTSARPARPRAVRFTPKPAQTWAGDGSKADTKRTKVRLLPRAGPSGLSLLPQTDGDEQNRIAWWSWPYVDFEKRKENHDMCSQKAVVHWPTACFLSLLGTRAHGQIGKRRPCPVAEPPPSDPGHLPGLAGSKQQRSAD